MITNEEITEYNNEDGVKESKHIHPTMRQVEKQMQGFPDELKMFVYHHLNGREEDARSYLQEWEDEQEQLRNYFKKINDLNQENQILSADNVIDGNDKWEHTSPDSINNAEEQGIHPEA